MRSLIASIALFAAAVPAVAPAQDVPGIDLSAPPQEPERAGGDEQPTIDLSKPPEPAEATPPPAAAAPSKKEERPREFQGFSEKDVALGDKVKAVQRKGFIKRHRFELAPIFATTVNDAFFQKFGFGARLAYNLHDSFAVAARYTRFVNRRSDNVREAKIAFQSQVLESRIDQQAMLDGVWSPIYGKASFRGKDIVHFDLYLSAGFGYVWTATSGEPRDLGPHLATDFGGGVRFYPKEWLAFDLGVLATLYPDQPIERLPATTQKVFAANVGVSFFWPFTFDYVHP
jgi:outer membrane beta-barrel protein